MSNKRKHLITHYYKYNSFSRVPHTHVHTHIYFAYRMQSQDCWYWTPVAVAVTPWIVSESR